MKKCVVDAFRKYLLGDKGAVAIDLIHLTVITLGMAIFFHGTFFPSALGAASLVADKVTKGVEPLHEDKSMSTSTPLIVEW